MIQQRAYLLQNKLGTFIGIIAFDSVGISPKEIMSTAWGTVTTVIKELDASDLAKIARKGEYAVYLFA